MELGVSRRLGIMNLTRSGKFALLILMLVTSACSSSKPKEDSLDAAPPVADAGTDAVPAPSAEISSSPGTLPPSLAGDGIPDDYKVQQGDTLMKIAFDIFGDVFLWKKIYEANKDKITDPNVIPKGLVLKIDKPTTPVSNSQTGEKYLIKTGDTLGKISNSLYGSPKEWKKLWEYNKQLIRDPNRIFAGFYLYYLSTPGEMKGSASGSSAEKAAPDMASSDTGSSSAPKVEASPTASSELPSLSSISNAMPNQATSDSSASAPAPAEIPPADEIGSPAP